MTSKEQAGLQSDLALLREFLTRAGVKPSYFTLPVGLALGVGLFELVGLWLLVSLTKGMVEMDFGFIRELRFVRSVFTLLPDGIAAAPWAPFMVLVSLVFGAFILKNVLQYASSVSAAYLVRRFGNSMRKLLLARCMEFGKLYFDRTNAGYLHSVLIDFTDRVASKMIDLQQFFTAAMTLLAYLGMMFYISWKLTLLGALVFPLLNSFQTRLIQRIRRTSASNVDAQKEMSRKVFNVLSCVPLVKSYATEEQEHRAFSKVSDLAQRYEFSIDKKILLILPVHEIIVLGLLLLLISAMALIVTQQGASRLPGLVVYFYVIRRATSTFGVMSHLKATLASVRGPIAAILDILDDEGKYFVADGNEEFPGLTSKIEFVDLSYSYVDGTPVLKHLSFVVEKGRMTAIVGASGAGKTTIVSLLARFYECPRGSILLDGKDIASFTLRSLRGAIGMVSQDAALLNDTLRANIAYGRNGRQTPEHLQDAIEKARLADYVSRLPQGLDTNVGDRGVQLSGGEKQRIAIARAMLKGSEILVLDEATSSLDSGTEKLIQEAIDEMIAGKTAIVIAHRLSTIKKADKIVVLDDGRVVEEGSLPELLAKKGLFFRYWEDQKFY